MEVSVSRTITIRIMAVLLLLIAGAEAYACDISDACFGDSPRQSSEQPSDCDQPAGDNCLCCCHHVMPVAVFVLEPADQVSDRPVPPLISQRASVPVHIDHPPQP
jgi:hypothetical protein